ncbi:MAG TPA: helix-turn-helix domain-containing protein [Actinomycetota bacterium]
MAPRAEEGAPAEHAHARLIPFRPGSSAVARALHAARRERGETLQMSSEATRLPVRYLAAFEADAAALVFRSPASAEPFLLEYARYLDLDLEALIARRRLRGPATGRAPPDGSDWSGRPPGKGGRPPALDRRRPNRAVGGRWPPLGTVLLIVGLVGMVGLSARMVARALGGEGGARKAALTGEAAAKGRPELPRGGRRLFPGHLVVALYGSPLTHRLGRLGLGPPSFAAEALRDQARAYEGTRPVLPALEVVSTVARGRPGPDGSYTNLLSEDRIEAYLAQARALRGLLIIDIQPGRRSFADDVTRYESFLEEPDVGLALDPEWRVGPGEIPGRQVGRVTAAEVNQVIDYLAAIVRRHDLPQKLLVIHQFTPLMINDRHRLHVPPEIALTFDIDGVGGRTAKIANYEDLAVGPRGSHQGIKLYYTRDVGLIAPWEILSLQPQPDLVVYQ